MTAKSFAIQSVQRAAAAFTVASEGKYSMTHLVHQSTQDVLNRLFFVDGGAYETDPLGRSAIGHFRQLAPSNIVLSQSSRTLIDSLDATLVPQRSQKQKIVEHEEYFFQVKFSVIPIRSVKQLLMQHIPALQCLLLDFEIHIAGDYSVKGIC